MSSTPAERIAARIRSAREALGISQAAASEAIPVLDEHKNPTNEHISLRTYARWERCQSTGFIDRLDDVAYALQTTSAELLGGEDPLTAQPTVEDLATKLDELLEEVRQIRNDLQPKRRR